MKRFDLRAFRRDRQLTQKQLADILGYKQNFISSIENGKGKQARDFPLEKIPVLEEHFGDISAYISEIDDVYRKEMEDEDPQKISEYPAYISSSNVNYISLPTRFLDELTKLTDTIHSQQRTIEKLVNKKIIN